jgi:hypothetical protein
MAMGWSALVFTPTPEAVQALRSSWSWVLPEQYELVLFSIFGDVFFRGSTGHVFWLNTGTAETSVVATSLSEFQSALSENCTDWFLPHLVEKLHTDGKVPSAGECYTYAVLPIFVEGKYEPWNFRPVPAEQHFEQTAHIHREIAALPDGRRVRIAVAP